MCMKYWLKKKKTANVLEILGRAWSGETDGRILSEPYEAKADVM